MRQRVERVRGPRRPCQPSRGKAAPRSAGARKELLEARVGIEPTDGAFAEPCLTTWLPRPNRRAIVWGPPPPAQAQVCCCPSLDAVPQPENDRLQRRRIAVPPTPKPKIAPNLVRPDGSATFHTAQACLHRTARWPRCDSGCGCPRVEVLAFFASSRLRARPKNLEATFRDTQASILRPPWRLLEGCAARSGPGRAGRFSGPISQGVPWAFFGCSFGAQRTGS